MLRRSFVLVMLLGLAALTLVPRQTRADRPPVIAIQAGHWRTNEQPDEFARLRTSTGAAAGGAREVDVNVDVAHRIAEYLRAWGNEAYVLPATIPPHYKADAFVAIHSDGNNNKDARGFKIATYYRNWVATDWLVRELTDQYAKDTGLPQDYRITDNMRNYYAFNFGLYAHTIDETTPGAIVEMGFLSNKTDRDFMTTHQDLIARSIALGIARFLAARPVTGWAPPPLMPQSDIVEVLHDRVPVFAGPSNTTPRVGTTYTAIRYAVTDRQPGWAKLFSWDGTERWVEDWNTRQISVP